MALKFTSAAHPLYPRLIRPRQLLKLKRTFACEVKKYKHKFIFLSL